MCYIVVTYLLEDIMTLWDILLLIVSCLLIIIIILAVPIFSVLVILYLPNKKAKTNKSKIHKEIDRY